MSHTHHVHTPRILLAAALFLLLGVAPLAAGDSRWYLNLKLGKGSLDTEFGKALLNHFDDDTDTGSVEVGYILRRHLAIQAGYHDLGEYAGSGSSCAEDAFCLTIYPLPDISMTADVSGLSLSLVPRLPLLDDRLTVYGKLGVIDWNSDLSGDFGFHDSYSDTDLLSGVGLRYGFKNGFGVLAEYERLDFDQQSASLGASWRF